MERYEKPEMEVIVFDEEEIRTAPGGGFISGEDVNPNSGTLNHNF